MKCFLLAVSVLALFGGAWAQGENPLCSQVVVGPVDSTCNSFTNDCPNSDHGCQISTFTAQCTGNYDIDAWLTATSGDHLNCKVCVKVEENVSPYTVVGSCTLDLCLTANRTRTCAAAARLTADHEYRIVVCLTYCVQANSCENQCTSAQAHGCVRYATTAPCW